MDIIIYTLNSFAKSKDGGNPAGVVLDADSLSEQQMRKIAETIGYSETAFVMNSNCADYKLRFFTPNEEVDLCGHATIAAFSVLASKGQISVGVYRQETKAGILQVELKDDMTVLMDQNVPEFFEVIDKGIIAESLNITTDQIMDKLPIQVVSTGLKDIMVPIVSMKALDKIMPNHEKIIEISRKYGVTGYHVFTLETLSNSTAYCRNFAPLYGIPEESATGTSNGALSCYLYEYDFLNNETIKNIIIEQGYSMKKPSEIYGELSQKNNKITKVKIGGKTMDLKEIELKI